MLRLVLAVAVCAAVVVVSPGGGGVGAQGMGSDEEPLDPCARVAAAEVAAAADDDEMVTVPDPVLLTALDHHLGLGTGEPVTCGALRSLW